MQKLFENWRRYNQLNEAKMGAWEAIRRAWDMVPSDQQEKLKHDASRGDYKSIIRNNPNLIGGAVANAVGPIAGNALALLISKMFEDKETGEGSFENSKEIYLKHAKELGSLGFADVGSEETGEIEDEEATSEEG
tara:strand:+ start:34334 stop:34738 length:405 start_codon:yes stop_codon:yes gene_type:complete